MYATLGVFETDPAWRAKIMSNASSYSNATVTVLWVCGAHQPWGPLDNSNFYSLTPCFLDAVLYFPFYLVATLFVLRKVWHLTNAKPPPDNYKVSRTADAPLTQPPAAGYLLLDEGEMGHDLAELCAKRTPEAYEILCDLASIDLVEEERKTTVFILVFSTDHTTLFC